MLRNEIQVPSCPQRWLHAAREFVHVLGERFTYSPRRNPEVVFGFLWGIPVPVFALGIHIHAAGLACTFSTCLNTLSANLFYMVFFLHPLLFAVIFGALGTMRAHREARICKLVDDEKCRVEELRKANERLHELDHLKSEFLANVTHELKSPLVTALGYTDRILGQHLGPVNERQRKGLEIGKRNLIRLRAQIDEILDFSRLEAGVVKMERLPLDLWDVVKAAGENLALLASEREVVIKLGLPTGPVSLMGDAAKLHQVVLNLLENAIKFSSRGKAVAVALSKQADAWRLSVKDQGIGIQPEVLPKLFQRFYQADGSLSRTHQGVGLGLVITRKIVEAHGGRIWIESEAGRGTDVHVELPLLKTESHQEKEVAYATNSAD